MRRVVVAGAVLAALAGVIAVVAWPSAAPPAPAVDRSEQQVESDGPAPAAIPARAPLPPKLVPAAAGGDGSSEREQARLRLERAEYTLEQYRLSTRYPPTSRPLTEHPDRIRLHDPAERTKPLDSHSSTKVTAGQDRTFIRSDEAAKLWIRCATENGAPVPCRINDAATVSVINEDGAVATQRQAPLTFHDDGQQGDDAANDGTWTALLQPNAIGMGDVAGTLRVDVEVTDGDDRGTPFFTLVATGEAPATFTRQISESIVDGSLVLGAGMTVKLPGHYRVTGRVDDAAGKPLALVEFDDELAAGERVAPLVVFGKLIRDSHPAFPLHLRDVEAFLLVEDAFPDRRMVPPLEGPVYATRVYEESQFSDAEWTSEERQRYLTELGNEVDRAKSDLANAPPAP